MFDALRIASLVLLLSATRSAAQYDFSAVDRLLQDSLGAIAGTGGGCGLILIKDGKVIYSRAFALLGKSFSVNSYIPIASASKWLSAGVIMSLVDEGRLSLDDTAGTFLPSFSGEKAGITVRQMFSHTSGLAVADAPCLDNRDVTLAECVDEIAAMESSSKPGRFFYYAGNSMQAAGRIAEIASGLSFPSGNAWDSLFKSRIARPLGLTRTNYDGLVNSNNPRVPGGAWSSAEEYATYLMMLLDGGEYNGTRILSEKAVAEMLKDQTGGVPIIFSPYMLYPGIPEVDPATRYGIGNWRESVDGQTGRLRESSSQGKFGFSPWIDHDRNMVGVLAVYSDLTNVIPTYVQLKKLIKQAVDGTSAVGADLKSSPSRMQLVCDPLSGGTTVRLSLQQRGSVSLALFDLLGNRVHTVIEGEMEGGEHRIELGLGELSVPSGMYMVRLIMPGFSEGELVGVVR